MTSDGGELSRAGVSLAPPAALASGAALERPPPRDAVPRPWKVAVVDDEKAVHAVTRLVLRDFRFKNRPIEILSEYSAAGAKRLMLEHPDIAVLVLDVVMEAGDAGLGVVKYLREELNNSLVRIMLRTGQPGEAPEHQVISDYDINDYKEKSQLTASKLKSALTTALRTYEDLLGSRQQGNSARALEETVKRRTGELAAANEALRSEMEDSLRVLEALRRNEALFVEAQRIAEIGSFDWSVASGDVVCSDQLCSILGLAPRPGPRKLDDLLVNVAAEDRARVRAALHAALQPNASYRFEHRVLRPDGTPRIVLQQGEAQGDAAGRPQRVIGVVRDITDWRAADEKLRKLSAAIEQTADAVMITDRRGVIEYVNAAFTSTTGYEREEALGKTPRILKSEKQPEILYRRMWNAILRGEVFSDVFVNRRKDGSAYYEAKTVTPQRNQAGEVTHFISTGRDVTERMLIQGRIEQLAHHDALTGLPNRALLADRLEQALARAKWTQRHVAVLFLDMDRLKAVNDNFGHDVGDLLLKGVAQRLTACVRDGDTVARLGGDEFAVILNDVASREDVAQLAHKIFDSMRDAFTVEGRELSVTTSMGISLFPGDGDTGQELLKRADAAMYRAKAGGRNGYQFYTEHEAKSLKKRGVEAQLRRALERDEFLLAYQPQVDLSSGTIRGLEALLRWRRPSGQIITPLDFIPLLEETGMIVEVGEWVLRTACATMRALRDAGEAPGRIAVNISLRQIRQAGFAGQVEEALEKAELAPELLELELTEAVLGEDVRSTVATLEALHALGVRLAVDGFGAGYASIHYLRRLPFDALKIDRAFIREVPADGEDAAIVKAIISVAHSMDLETVAEGIERDDQLRFVGDLGCHAAQGHLFSAPLPAPLVGSFLKSASFPGCRYPLRPSAKAREA
jgi:diguanylate cyclase (GGDEF)-like protein/PAS domain S-box-containing protein